MGLLCLHDVESYASGGFSFSVGHPTVVGCQVVATLIWAMRKVTQQKYRVLKSEVLLSGVRSECLTCAFRASCCSARLSRAQVLTFAFPLSRAQNSRVHSRVLNTGVSCRSSPLPPLSPKTKQNKTKATTTTTPDLKQLRL